MISNQVLQTSIDELRAITRIDLCVMDLAGNVVVSTFLGDDIQVDAVKLFAKSEVDSQVVSGYHFFKIFDERALAYVLVSAGASEDASMIGKVAVSQIQHLLIAYKERFDKNNFIQNLLLDNLLLIDIYNRAKKLHIAVEARRVVFLIETRQEKDSIALETMKNLFASRTKDFITAVDERNIILVRELKANEGYAELAETASMIRDMLNSEAMSAVRIAYGSIVDEIKQVSKSYKEAKMALDVGRIFSSEKEIIAYSTLGIGRLIYQLPMSLCEMFIREIFDGNIPKEIDEEALTTINKFFENNLNVSETARQLYVHRNTLVYRLEKIQKSSGLDIRTFDDALTFKIALMVASYMKYMKAEE